MNKAIELLERLSEQLKYNSDTLSLAVYKYVKMRKELEQTPITEEWLKKHRFRRIKTEYDLTPYYQKGEYESEGIIMVWIEEKTIHVRYRPLINGGRNYADLRDVFIPCKVLADLYYACELCGIKLE